MPGESLDTGEGDIEALGDRLLGLAAGKGIDDTLAQVKGVGSHSPRIALLMAERQSQKEEQ